MSKPPSMSPYARTFLRPRAFTAALLIGVIGAIPVFWIMVVVGLSNEGSPGPVLIVLAIFLGILALPVFFHQRGRLRARRHNQLDWDKAVSIADAFEELLRRPHADAYEKDSGVSSLSTTRILEAERHFDQDTTGSVTGELHSRFSFNGGGFSVGLGRIGVGFFRGGATGVSVADLDMNLVGRSNLLSDALFAVVEIEHPDGGVDTMRVVSVSDQAIRAHMASLLNQLAQHYAGAFTHAGATVLQYRDRVVDRFAPRDLSYLTDQVHHAQKQDVANLRIEGLPVGRNAVLVVSAALGSRDGLDAYPLAFPRLLGAAMASVEQPAVSAGVRSQSALT